MRKSIWLVEERIGSAERLGNVYPGASKLNTKGFSL
jgi:hypothetical protein